MTQDNRPPEPSEKEKELLEDAREAKAEIEQAQSEALEAIAQDDTLEDYETVTLGELELKVKAWLPGEIQDTVLQAQQLGESGDPADIKRSMETMISALAEMSESDTYNTDFWREFYQKWGAEGMVKAVSTVLEPASEARETREDSLQSFRRD